MLENLILAALVSVTVWLMMRRWRMNRMRKQAAAEAQSGPRPTMPRMGTPGTITNDQIKVLKEYNFEPSPQWSVEEAALILAGATYARAVLTEVTGRREHAVELQNQVFTFIMGEEALRQYVADWARNLARLRPTDRVPPPKHNEQFERVAAYVRSLPNK
ncbi:MAG: hypothetical protein AB7F67_00415 [Rhodospirillaceae bacterium]